MFPLYAGLRLSELKRLQWRDLDLDRGSVTVRKGKAKRIDEVPLHPDLLAELHTQKPSDVLPSDRVFPTVVTNETRRKDFVRAGIALVDEEGKHADLHGLRVTLATMLARNGAAPQVARQIMRHSQYSTTLRYYTHLTLADTSAAINALRPTGGGETKPHHQPHHSEHERARSGAS
jgi:integrase